VSLRDLGPLLNQLMKILRIYYNENIKYVKVFLEIQHEFSKFDFNSYFVVRVKIY
jgi:hypothetical protein